MPFCTKSAHGTQCKLFHRKRKKSPKLTLHTAQMQPRTATAQKCKQTLQNEFSNNNRQTRSPFIVRKKKRERKRSNAKKHALSQTTKPGRGQVRCCAIWMKLKKKHTQKIRRRVKKRNHAKTRGEKIITNEKCKKKCMPSVHFRLLCTYSFCRTMWGCFAFLSACSCWGWSPPRVHDLDMFALE